MARYNDSYPYSELRYLSTEKAVKTFHSEQLLEPLYEPQCLPFWQVCLDDNADLYWDWLVPWRAAGRP